MHKPSSDLERVYKALEDQWEIDDLSCDLSIIAELQKMLRKGEWKITAAVFSRAPGGGNRLVAIWPGFHDKAYRHRHRRRLHHHRRPSHQSLDRRGRGLRRADESADPLRRGSDEPRLLCDDESGRREGNDRRHPPGAATRWREEVAEQAGIELNDILEVVLVGNPVMHHLFLGIDPTELGGAPFALATGLAVTCPARELDLKLNPGAWAYVLPCIAGPCRGRHGGRGAVGGAARAGRDHAGRRCRHQCRDRAGLEGAAARLFLAHGPRLRRRADFVAASAPHPAPSSASASTPRRWSRATR